MKGGDVFARAAMFGSFVKAVGVDVPRSSPEELFPAIERAMGPGAMGPGGMAVGLWISEVRRQSALVDALLAGEATVEVDADAGEIVVRARGEAG